MNQLPNLDANLAFVFRKSIDDTNPYYTYAPFTRTPEALELAPADARYVEVYELLHHCKDSILVTRYLRPPPAPGTLTPGDWKCMGVPSLGEPTWSLE